MKSILFIGIGIFLASSMAACKARNVVQRKGAGSNMTAGSLDQRNEGDSIGAVQEPSRNDVIETPTPEPPQVVVRSPIAYQTVLRQIVTDLNALTPDARRRTRYFFLTHLYNAGVDDERLEEHRAGLHKLLNSLSRQREIVKAESIDRERTIYRISLQDYGWSQALWETIASRNPYGIERGLSEEPIIRALTGSPQAYVRSDWFSYAASQGFLYNTILGIPRTRAELERQLGININDNIRRGRIVRSATITSGVSANNRMVERHAIQDGFLWLSYDFAAVKRETERNLMESPLSTLETANGFQQDGGEIIFSLPNGLQAYMIIDGQGNRLDIAPIAIVSDFRRPSREVINGISCIGCHGRGLNKMRDMVREAVDANPAGYTAAEIELIRRVYPGASAVDEIMEADKARFAAAMEKLGSPISAGEMFNTAPAHFEADLTPEVAAAELFLSVEELRRFINDSAPASRTFGVLLLDNGRVKREVFEHRFSDLVTLFRLGRTLRSDEPDVFEVAP